jgi:hypothetical protein
MKFDHFNQITPTDDLKDQIEWKNKIIENIPKKIEKNSTGEIIQGKITVNYQKGNLIFSMVSFSI